MAVPSLTQVCTGNSSSRRRLPALTPSPAVELSHSSRPANSGSRSSTIVESQNGSMMTLLPETSIYEIPEDPITQLKESIRYTSPIVRTLSPVAKSPRGKGQTFSPEDLTRALIAVQLCT